MSKGVADFDASGGIPNLAKVIVARRGDRLSVWMNAASFDAILMLQQRTDRKTGLGIPDTRGSVIAACHEAAAILSVDDLIDVTAVKYLQKLGPGLDFPNAR